jgi:hypothetical protein
MLLLFVQFELLLVAIFPLAALGHKRLWIALLIPPVCLAWGALVLWTRHLLARSLNLCCPYCRASLFEEWSNQILRAGGENAFVNGRCRRCQRMIIDIPNSDGAPEMGKDE